MLARFPFLAHNRAPRQGTAVGRRAERIRCPGVNQDAGNRLKSGHWSIETSNSWKIPKRAPHGTHRNAARADGEARAAGCRSRA
jgi:hypothetical protein